MGFCHQKAIFPVSRKWHCTFACGVGRIRDLTCVISSEDASMFPPSWEGTSYRAGNSRVAGTGQL